MRDTAINGRHGINLSLRAYFSEYFTRGYCYPLGVKLKRKMNLSELKTWMQTERVNWRELQTASLADQRGRSVSALKNFDRIIFDRIIFQEKSSTSIHERIPPKTYEWVNQGAAEQPARRSFSEVGCPPMSMESQCIVLLLISLPTHGHRRTRFAAPCETKSASSKSTPSSNIQHRTPNIEHRSEESFALRPLLFGF